jgi:hypothetical protein
MPVLLSFVVPLAVLLFRAKPLFLPQLLAPTVIKRVLTAAATQSGAPWWDNATFWKWVERTSWIVIVFGLILTLYQLRQLLEEARAHSALEVGFRSNPTYGPISKHQTSSAFRQSSEWYRTTLTFVTRNTGNSSARDISINYVFPEGMAFPETANAQIPRAAKNEIRAVPIEGDALIVVSTFDYLHPDCVNIDSLIIDVPTAFSDFEVQVSIFRSDSERFNETLKVGLSPTDSEDAATPTQPVLDALKREVVSDVGDAEDEHVSVADRLRTWRGSEMPR